MGNLDKKDLLILKLLQEDANISNKEIAVSTGLTVTPVFERIKKLNAAGVLRKKVYLVDRKQVGLNLIVLISVSLKQHTKEHVNEFMQEMKKHIEVVECFHVSGAFDFHLKIITQDIEKYQDFMLNKISTIKSIGHIESYFVMKEVKNTTSLPIV
jgi:DNA-binding Lrp family transcriptional regulator